MRLFPYCVLLLALTCLVLPAQEAQVAAPSTAAVPRRAVVDVERLDGAIAAAREAWNVPGLAVAIVADGKVVLARGYGVRKLGQPDAVDADTLFAIASNTKAFTAAAVCMLQEDQKLKLGDRVRQHLPWMEMYSPYVTAELRVDDLLCHRSGLGTFSGDLLWWGTRYSPEQVLRRVRYLPPAGPFRAHYGYSNLMFLAAGEVVATASGMSWSEFIQRRILEPLQMTRTQTSVRQLEGMENVATPHKSKLQEVVPIEWYNWDTMAAAGGIISSANDMSRWLRVQLDRGRIDDQRRLFSAASSHRMWSPYTVIPVSPASLRRNPETHFRAYGLGWALADYKGRKTVSHGGGYDGMYSRVVLVPEEKLGIVVLTNSMTGISSAICNQVLDEYLGGSKRDWSAEGLKRDSEHRQEFYDLIRKTTTPKFADTSPSRNREAYAGRYRSQLYGDATVTIEGEGLVLRLLPNRDLVADLRHLQFDTYTVHWRREFAWFGGGTAHFVMNADGQFSQIELDIPNDDLWFYELKLNRVK